MFNLNTWWYQNRVVLWPLMPMTFLYTWLVKLRRKFYQKRISARQVFPVPVIVVGNLTVGGTGKTPLVMYLVELLKKEGWQPGIVSGGYKGNHKAPISVSKDSLSTIVGDEAIVLARRLQCPIVVGRNRRLAVEKLLKEDNVNIIISDDGLQHYALHRDIEIAVMDGERRFGNGYCLPVGPLREPKNRLLGVDLIVNNGGEERVGEYTMEYKAGRLYNALDFENQQSLDSFRGKKVHAVAGIGNPTRFFQLLTSYGLQVIAHPYPDHYAFTPEDIDFKDNLPVLMTEKDVVKCFEFVNDYHWVLPITANLDPLFVARLLTLVKGLCHG